MLWLESLSVESKKQTKGKGQQQQQQNQSPGRQSPVANNFHSSMRQIFIFLGTKSCGELQEDQKFKNIQFLVTGRAINSITINT